MNIYEFIDSQKDDMCVQELAKYLCEKYNLENDLFYIRDNLGLNSDVNIYEITLGENDISIYEDNEITILSRADSNGITRKDIKTFFKYYKRKQILDGLL